jgi:hypothetical protein
LTTSLQATHDGQPILVHLHGIARPIPAVLEGRRGVGGIHVTQEHRRSPQQALLGMLLRAHADLGSRHQRTVIEQAPLAGILGKAARRVRRLG